MSAFSLKADTPPCANDVGLGPVGDVVVSGQVDVGRACPNRFSIRKWWGIGIGAPAAGPANVSDRMGRRMKFFTEDDVRRLLHWKPLIDAMETALTEFSTGKVIQPVRNMITIEEGKRYLGIMPAVGKTPWG